MVGIIISGKNFVTVEQDSIATPEKRTKSPLRKRAPTPPDVPTTASLTPRTPFEYTARKEWTQGFRQVTILSIVPMQADLWKRFGMRMELYRPSDEVRSLRWSLTKTALGKHCLWFLLLLLSSKRQMVSDGHLQVLESQAIQNSRYIHPVFPFSRTTRMYG